MAYAVANADERKDVNMKDNRVFVVCAQEKEVGKFEISLNKTEGLSYTHIFGLEPNWHDLVSAITAMFVKFKLSAKAKKYVYGDCYIIRRNNNFDTRFVPVLINTKQKIAKKLPMTIDEDRILEHSFQLPFSAAVKTMLALSMSYGEEYLELDPKKYGCTQKRATGEIIKEVS